MNEFDYEESNQGICWKQSEEKKWTYLRKVEELRGALKERKGGLDEGRMVAIALQYP